MTRFRLATLLRVRSAEKDAAAADLAEASLRERQSAAVVNRARTRLAGLAGDAAEVNTLRAIAAGRLAAAGMLAELGAREAVAAEAAEAAREGFRTAGVRLRTLTKLEQRHRDLEREAELAAEQAALDEVGGRGLHPSVPAGSARGSSPFRGSAHGAAVPGDPATARGVS